MHKIQLNHNINNNSKLKTAFNYNKQKTITNSNNATNVNDLHRPLQQQNRPQQHYHNFNSNNNSNTGVASIDLEQYIEAMEARTTASERTPETDVWTQLQQKESDILLAAELGKALLEKNEELVKQQEKLIEDYSAKIEVLLKKTLL
uniref:HAP1 N-terminal domain-containing protein n=1 Tax=Glossina brevipalpis TaxID=37001 RepID=A0A1A9WCS5_9MUSC